MTYRELMAQAQELVNQANALRETERRDAIASIRKTMQELGISVESLGPTKKGTPQFRGPEGQLWNGTKGPRPGWVKDAIARGESLEQYRIQN